MGHVHMRYIRGPNLFTVQLDSLLPWGRIKMLKDNMVCCFFTLVPLQRSGAQRCDVF